MKKLLLLASNLILMAFVAVAQDGTLDAQFATSGIATVQFSNATSDAHAIGLQPDGKILIAGVVLYGGSRVAIARYNTDGTLDNTFGNAGKSTLTITGQSYITSIAIQADGKIVLAGSLDQSAMVVRITAAGALDPTFGGTGYATYTDGGFTKFEDLRILSNGKIMTCGFASTKYGLVRWNADGTADATFGTGGYVLNDVGLLATLRRMSVQSDGKILLTGTVYNSTNYDLIVARFKTDGSFDTSFGTGGKAISSISAGNNETGNDIAIQSDGKIVITGRVVIGAKSSVLVARYNINGTLDTSFGTNGATITAVGTENAEGISVALMGSGKVIVAGFAGTSKQFLVMRYTAAGALDSGFGTAGVTKTLIGTKCYADEVRIQSNGKVILGGTSEVSNVHSFALARYNNTGTTGLGDKEEAIQALKVFPNPVINSRNAQVQFTLEKATDGQISIVDNQGKIQKAPEAFSFIQGKNDLSIEWTADLADGIYFIVIETENGLTTAPFLFRRN